MGLISRVSSRTYRCPKMSEISPNQPNSNPPTKSIPKARTFNIAEMVALSKETAKESTRQFLAEQKAKLEKESDPDRDLTTETGKKLAQLELRYGNDGKLVGDESSLANLAKERSNKKGKKVKK